VKNRSIGVDIVDSLMLREATCYPSGLVGAIGFDMKYPLHADGLASFWEKDKVECAIEHKGIELSLHCCNPLVLVDQEKYIMECDRDWQWMVGNVKCEGHDLVLMVHVGEVSVGFVLSSKKSVGVGVGGCGVSSCAVVRIHEDLVP
jgi:hypothetical protein